MSEALDIFADSAEQQPVTSLAIVQQCTSTIVALDKDDILGALRAKLAALPTDISTKKNRDAIASAAHAVSTTKTTLLKLADASIEDAKKTVKSVTAEKKALEEMMDALRDRVRAPVTEFERVERDRVAANERRIAEIAGAGRYSVENWEALSVEAMQDRLREINGERQAGWDLDFRQRAQDTIDAACFKISQAIALRQAKDIADAEAERRRQEEAEAARVAAKRAQREREARIAAEAAERARKEAEARADEAAAAERQRVEQERLDAEDRAREAEIAAQAKIEALEEANRIAAAQAEQALRDAEARALQAESDRIETEQRAKREAARLAQEAEIKARAAQAKADADAAAAVMAERRRQIEEAARDKREADARAADRENKARVHREMAADLAEHAGLTAEQSRRSVEAMARGMIRNVGVEY